MNIFIANSEEAKVNLLEEIFQKLDSQIQVIGKTVSYEETMLFCSKNAEKIDLVICQVYFDGTPATEIASSPTLLNRVTFTSSRKEDAYEALKANAFDFLLEPFSLKDVSDLIGKVYTSKKGLKTHDPRYKQRFMIKFGDKIQYRTVEEIAYMYAEGKMAYIITKNPSRRYIIEYTLDELEKRRLDPSSFFRINRKFIVNINSIEEARQYVNSRLKLILNPPTEFDMVVSREKVHAFKRWLNI